MVLICSRYKIFFFFIICFFSSVRYSYSVTFKCCDLGGPQYPCEDGFKKLKLVVFTAKDKSEALRECKEKYFNSFIEEDIAPEEPNSRLATDSKKVSGSTSFRYRCCEIAQGVNYPCDKGFKELKLLVFVANNKREALEECRKRSFDSFVREDENNSRKKKVITVSLKSSDVISFEEPVAYSIPSRSFIPEISCDEHNTITLTSSVEDVTKFFDGIEGVLPQSSKLVFKLNGKKLKVSKHLREKFKQLLLKGPNEGCYIEIADGTRHYTCHQFSLNLGIKNDFDIENMEMLINDKSKHDKITDFNQVHSGDWILFLGKDGALMHSAVYLAKLESGEHLFISKIGKGPIVVSELNELLKVYSADSFVKVKKK